MDGVTVEATGDIRDTAGVILITDMAADFGILAMVGVADTMEDRGTHIILITPDAEVLLPTIMEEEVMLQTEIIPQIEAMLTTETIPQPEVTIQTDQALIPTEEVVMQIIEIQLQAQILLIEEVVTLNKTTTLITHQGDHPQTIQQLPTEITTVITHHKQEATHLAHRVHLIVAEEV